MQPKNIFNMAFHEHLSSYESWNNLTENVNFDECKKVVHSAVKDNVFAVLDLFAFRVLYVSSTIALDKNGPTLTPLEFVDFTSRHFTRFTWTLPLWVPMSETTTKPNTKFSDMSWFHSGNLRESGNFERVKRKAEAKKAWKRKIWHRVFWKITPVCQSENLRHNQLVNKRIYGGVGLISLKNVSFRILP